MKHATHHDQTARLKRIQGQVSGLIRMVEEERYCVDILTQIRAVRAALRKVEEQILREHVEHCVGDALRANEGDEARRKVDELFDVLNRFTPQ
ncbi:MAG: metal-sensitive transcriptional regulator [Gammaproteobacteria bacterium]|jgi:DNA-binding FrmR family transcriptional regulator